MRVPPLSSRLNITFSASSRHFLSLEVHNCLLVWSPYALKCMFVCALCKNTFLFFLVLLKLFVEFDCCVPLLHSFVLNHLCTVVLGVTVFLLFADLQCTECNFSLQCTLSLLPRTCAKAFLQNMSFLLRFDYGCSDEGKESPSF